MAEVRYKFTVSTPYEGSAITETVDVFDYTTFSPEEWAALSDDAREEELNEIWREWCWTVIDGGWGKVE